VIKRLANAPVAFMVIGALLFIFDFTNANDTTTIELSESQKKSLIAYEQQKLGRPLTQRETSQAMSNHIQEEVLLKAAYDLGLNNDDVIRKRLLNKMKFVLTAQIAEATEEDLRHYYQTHQKEFVKPNTVSFQQYYLPQDKEHMVSDVLEALNTNLPPAKLIHTDRFPANINNATTAEISSRFSANVADAVNSVTFEEWHGPYSSPYGLHFIYVTERNEGNIASFDESRRYIANAWRETQKNKLVIEKAIELAENYSIEVKGDFEW
jgi:hypothetical protein